MALKINFNDPNIIRGYFDQEFPSMGLDEAGRSRFVIGREGGIAYRLFDGSIVRTYPTELIVRCASDISAGREYSMAVINYLHEARALAGERGFLLVYANNVCGDLCIGPWTEKSYLYLAGIGAISLESADKFEKFVNMIRDGRGKLDVGLQEVKTLADKLRKDKS